VRLAYLTPQYPKPSHSFIRREIQALEARGFVVLRLSIRKPEAPLVDAGDLEEETRTIYCLSGSPLPLLIGSAITLLAAPGRGLQALSAAVKMSRRCDRGLLRHLAYLAEAAFLCRVLRQHRIDHLHVHFGTNAASVAYLVRILGGPGYSLTLHGPDEFDSPIGHSLAAKVEGATFVAAVSDYTSAQIRRWVAPEAWPRIHVIRCGVEGSFFDERPSLPPSTRRLVCVGRLTPQKGQLLLIEAFAALLRSGLQAELVLAGDGELRPIVEQRICEEDLQKYVTITGWIDERAVRQQLKEARCLVLPSFAEGLPVVIMEAFAMGRPVISTYVAGIPELVRPGKSGWLVPAGNVEELSTALREACELSPEHLLEMGREGARRVQERHRVDVEAQQLASLFESSVRGRP
jgi:glycosyltransferase involved in cell wall biosynthesis